MRELLVTVHCSYSTYSDTITVVFETECSYDDLRRDNQMKVYVIARKPIIAAATGKRFPDNELQRMDGIRYCQIYEVEAVTEKLKRR